MTYDYDTRSQEGHDIGDDVDVLIAKARPIVDEWFATNPGRGESPFSGPRDVEYDEWTREVEYTADEFKIKVGHLPSAMDLAMWMIDENATGDPKETQ